MSSHQSSSDSSFVDMLKYSGGNDELCDFSWLMLLSDDLEDCEVVDNSFGDCEGIDFEDKEHEEEHEETSATL